MGPEVHPERPAPPHGPRALPEVTLAAARDKALAARRLLVEGVDPLAERAKVPAMSFRDAAEAVIEAKTPGWRNEKHAAQWWQHAHGLRLPDGSATSRPMPSTPRPSSTS